MPTRKAMVPVDVRSVARGHTAMCMRVLAHIAKSPKASDNARVTACGMLLDRGWGKAQQDVASRHEITVIIRKLAEEQSLEPLTIEHDATSPEGLSPADIGLEDSGE